VAEIRIPTGPIDSDPYGAIRPIGSEFVSDANGAALAQVLDGLELGDHDRRILNWLCDRDTSAVATVCSWILRARAAETAGRIVLDEPDELGLTDDEGDGRDTVGIVNGEILIYTRGAYWLTLDPDEAEEWAAHLAGMAVALRAKAATPPTPPAAAPSAVLRHALVELQGRDVLTAIRAAAGDEQLATAALRELGEYIGYGQLDPADAVARWQDLMAEHEIRSILGRAADHAEREGR
jgi:hypothetical protein